MAVTCPTCLMHNSMVPSFNDGEAREIGASPPPGTESWMNCPGIKSKARLPAMVSRRTRKRDVSPESFCRLVIVAGSGIGVVSRSHTMTDSLEQLQEVYPYRT